MRVLVLLAVLLAAPPLALADHGLVMAGWSYQDERHEIDALHTTSGPVRLAQGPVDFVRYEGIVEGGDLVIEIEVADRTMRLFDATAAPDGELFIISGHAFALSFLITWSTDTQPVFGAYLPPLEGSSSYDRVPASLDVEGDIFRIRVHDLAARLEERGLYAWDGDVHSSAFACRPGECVQSPDGVVGYGDALMEGLTVVYGEGPCAIPVHPPFGLACVGPTGEPLLTRPDL